MIERGAQSPRCGASYVLSRIGTTSACSAILPAAVCTRRRTTAVSSRSGLSFASSCDRNHQQRSGSHLLLTSRLHRGPLQPSAPEWPLSSRDAPPSGLRDCRTDECTRLAVCQISGADPVP